MDTEWGRPTKATLFDYTFKKPGTYIFEAQAIDRDLNYSEPASLTLEIIPTWYLRGRIAFPSGGAIMALLASSIFFGLRYYIQRREAQILQRNPELQSNIRNAIGTIEDSGMHLLALINDILDLSKIGMGRMELQKK